MGTHTKTTRNRAAALKAALRAAPVVATSVFFAADAAAQGDGAEDNAAPDVVTIYGTSNPLPAFEYPGQVTVITREAIDTFAPSAMSDLMRDAPGVEFSGGPRRTGETPSLRGLGGENVLILLDGARQSFISAHDGRFFIDPELLRSAEVVRGPASALYGSGAAGGVLAFESIDAADLLEADEGQGLRFRFGYQGVNAETLAAVTGFARQGRLDLVAGVGARASGDIALGSGVDLPSDDDIATALVKAGFAVSDALNLEASWQRFANTALEPNNGQGVITSSDPILAADVEKDIASDTVRLGATFDPQANDLVDARLTVYRTEGSVGEYDASLDRLTVRDITTTGASVRNAMRVRLGETEATVTVGADWYRDEQVGRDDAASDGTRDGVPDGMQEFTGLFAQAELAFDAPLGLPGELLVIPGVRYDSFEHVADGAPSVTDDAVSPRLGASYGPTPWLRLFASYAEGFRAPSINELYLDGVHFSLPHPVLFDPSMGSFVFINNTFVANPTLVPEDAATTEFGAGVDFHDVFGPGDRLQAKASYYESDVDDLINLFVDFAFDDTCFAPPFQPCSAGTTNAANLDRGELSGVEAEATFENGRVRARATFASIEGTDANTGGDLGALTPNRLNLDLRLKLPERRAVVGTRLQIAGDFSRTAFDVDTNQVALAETRDGYSVVDVYATWRPAFLDGLRLDLGVDNVFDQDYERVFEGVSEPGINPRIAVSYQVTR